MVRSSTASPSRSARPHTRQSGAAGNNSDSGTALAVAPVVAVTKSSTALAKEVWAWQREVDALPTVVESAGALTASVIGTLDEERHAVSLFARGKAFLKIVEKHPIYVEARDRIRKAREDLKTAEMIDHNRLNPGVALLERGIKSFRDEVKRKAAAAAEKEAKKQQEAEAQARDREEARLKREAAKATG